MADKPIILTMSIFNTRCCCLYLIVIVEDERNERCCDIRAFVLFVVFVLFACLKYCNSIIRYTISPRAPPVGVS